ncbi:MAG: universal stress protein [Desulfobacterales bacterium]|nr:universal stress protein [Desulfobacterales bacterium]
MNSIKIQGELKLKTSILFALNDSSSSRAAVDFLTNIPLCPEQVSITLLHVFRKPSSVEELMGEKYMQQLSDRYMQALENTKNKLIEKGYPPNNIQLKLISDPYPTVADGVIDQFSKGNYNIVIVGRKRMSKAEEFVLGDPSIKLVRALEGVAVMVIKSK